LRGRQCLALGLSVRGRLQWEVTSRLANGLALVFDMDGVLIDSNPVHCQAWETFNRRFGLEMSEAMRQGIYGRRNDQIVRELFGDSLSAEEISARGAAKEELYREMISSRIEDILVPGLRAFLERYSNGPMAVATNAEPANLDFFLDRAGLRSYFRVAVDGSQVANPKPHPEIYLRTADLLGMAPRNCIIFEDSYYGVEAGLASGGRVIGLSTTHGNLPGAVITIDNFLNGDLERWLEAQRAA
jgi:beta-phosphoglucomutase family hydrolase